MTASVSAFSPAPRAKKDLWEGEESQSLPEAYSRTTKQLGNEPVPQQHDDDAEQQKAYNARGEYF